MKKLFRIKSEAVNFYPKKYSAKVYQLQTWENEGVFKEALQEVEPVYIEYGIKKSECSSDLSGWKDNTTKIHMSISFNGTSYKENDLLTDNTTVRSLMNKMQQTVNNHFSDINL